MKDYVLELDKPRELRFGFRALREIRNKFGERSLDQLMNIKVDEIPFLAWVGLKHEDKALTVERVEDLLDDAIPKKYTIMKVTEIILNALTGQMGVEPKKTDDDDSKKEEAGDQVAETEKPKTETKEKPQPKKTTPSTKKRKK